MRTQDKLKRQALQIAAENADTLLKGKLNTKQNHTF